jgi:UDP-N-acetylglucosamine:LPS N-acetylglucosamine transferase
VLIVSASMGAGHDRAAAELGRRLAAAGHDYEIVDFLHLLPFGLGWLLKTTYEFQLRRCAWTYELGYRILGSAGHLLWRINVFLCSLLTRRAVCRTLVETSPNVVVSTYPFASLVLGHLRRTERLRVPVATYLTDFAVHPLWVHEGIDLHLAVSEDSAQEATQRGARESIGTGPLVSDQFRTPTRSRAEVRHALGIEESERVAMVVAGSLGFGAVPAVIDGIQSCGDYHVVAVCGSNTKLQASLLKAGLGGTVLGWTDEMAELMGAADVLVENAGGLTAMEAFAAGLPVISYQPIAGHGKDNARHMDSAHVSHYARTQPDLAVALEAATTPGPARDALIDAGHALFTEDPTERILGLVPAGQTGPVLAPSDRPGLREVASAARRAPSRWSLPERVIAIMGVVLGLFYVGITEGVEGAGALGVGVSKPPAGVQNTVYLGVRLTADELHNPTVLSDIEAVHATVIVDGRTAQTSATALAAVVSDGVDLANGGMGTHASLPWTRAANDCRRASAIIAHAAHIKPTEFVPGRGFNGFDQIYCRTGTYKAKLVLANLTFRVHHLPARLRSRRIYLLDGRGGQPSAIESTLSSFEQRLDSSGYQSRPLRDLH